MNPYLEYLRRIDEKDYLTGREHREYMKILTDALNDFYLMTKHIEEQDKLKNKLKRNNNDNEFYKLTWEWSNLMFEQRKDELGRNLTLDEMNQVAKEIIEEQERVLRESGAVNIETDLSKYCKK
jgi:hypothetical protein